MITFISVLIIMVSILLILVVLIQTPKGGLDSAFAAPSQLFGVRKTTDFLEKATWTMIGILIILCLITTNFVGGGNESAELKSEIQEQVENAPQPVQNPPQIPSDIPAPQQAPVNPN